MDVFNYGYQQNYSLEIYEFSRELLEISKKDERWVSGGFGAEVGKSNQDVPQKIRDAVNRGDFRINDNYPPKQQEYALIAREIDEYSVLAVATWAGDDKIRNLIAYRYFWLQKPAHQHIDGVGTLLIWWMSDATGEPKFDFEWTPNSRTLNYTAQYYLRENSYQYFDRYREHVQDILPKIEQYPFAYQFNEVESRNALHYLALYLNAEYGTPISWAWNVGWLEKPERFTLICSDQKETSHQYNSRYIQKHQKLLKKSPIPTSDTTHSPVTTSSETSSVKGNMRREESVTSNGQEPSNVRNIVKTSSTQNKSDLNQIRTSLKNIADNHNVEIEMQKLAVFLENYPGISFENNDIIDNYKKGFSNTSQIRYTALLAILGYIPVLEWLKNLKELKNKKYENAFLSIQKQLLDNSKQRENKSVYGMFKKNIKKNISELLLTFQQKNVRDIAHHNIKWLLLKSKSIWVKYFNEYAKELAGKLKQGVQPGDDQFYNALQQNNSEKNYQRYNNLALLFQNVPNQSLSGYFYQLSEGSVPSDIYDKADILIIPMTRKETNPGWNQYLTSQNIRTNPVLIFTLVILTFGSLFLGVLVPYFDKKQDKTGDETRQEQPGLGRNLQISMQVYKDKNDPKAKEEIKTYLEKFKSKNTEMRGHPEYDWIKQEFLPKENLEYPKEGKDYVKKAQIILNFIGYTVGTPDGEPGSTTKRKYQEFQIKNQKKEKIEPKELSVQGENKFLQGESTWKALTNQLTDKQVVETAKFLSSKLDTLPDSQQFQESINKLKNCQAKPFLDYINCVNPPNQTKTKSS